MKKVMKYPIYPITLSFVHGIFCGLYFPLSFSVVLSIAVVAFLSLLFLHFKKETKVFSNQANLAFFTSLYVLFFAIGMLNVKIHNVDLEPIDVTQKEFVVEIDEVLKANKYTKRAFGTLISEKSNVKVLVSIPKNDTLLKVGSVFKVFGTIKEIVAANNPNDFNYKEYLANKRIFYQITAYHLPIKMGEHRTITSQIIDLRENFIQRFSKMNYDKKTIGFIEALLFGIKNNLDQDVQTQFKELGVMHVLAVSGMHVVLLFGSISYVLRRTRLPNYWIDGILVFFLLIFCCMAGFSGSVMRAALMCIMLIVANYTHKRVFNINLLVGSMFMILLFEPNYLLDVGFQLSYLAVFSIVFCYPLVQKYFKAKNFVLNYFSQLIGVSLIAQLGVLPLSIYYFNQVPLLFLIGNIIAIPLTSFLLITWFVQLFLSFLSIDFAAYMTMLLQPVADVCFRSVEYVSNYFSLKSISIHLNAVEVVFLILFIYAVFWFFYQKSYKRLIVCLICVVGFQTAKLAAVFENKSKNETILMYDTKNIVFLSNYQQKGILIGEASAFTNKSILNYQLKNDVEVIQQEPIKNSFVINKQSWLVIDSLGVYPFKKYNYVVLYQNAKVNLDRLIKEVQPDKIILHNTNTQYLQKIYISYLQERKIPYYDMRSKGAYVLNYNKEINSSADL